jgi:pentatricopeptide repeat protein
MKKRADVLMLSGRIKKALRLFNEMLELDKSYALALKGRGCALACLGREDEAEECFDTVLKENPRDIGALNGKASVASSRGNPKEALEYCDKALAILPGDYTTLTLRDNFLEELGLPREMFASDCSKDYIFSDLNDRIQLLTKEEFLASEENKGGKFYPLEEFIEEFGESFKNN